MASVGVGEVLPTSHDRVVRPRPFVVRNGRVLFVWALLIALILAYISVVPFARMTSYGMLSIGWWNCESPIARPVTGSAANTRRLLMVSM